MSKKKNKDEERLDNIDDLTYEAVVNRQKDLADEIERVASKDTVTPEDDKYLTDLDTEFEQLDSKRKAMERKALIAKTQVVCSKPAVVQSGHSTKDLDDDPFTDDVDDEYRGNNPWDLSEIRTWNRSPAQLGQEYKSRAFTAIESIPGANDQRKAGMTKIIEEFDNQRGDLAAQLLATGSPAYMRAFVKAAQGRDAQFTVEEAKAVERAMSLTTTEGGFLIPFQLDPTVINTSDGSLNQIRQAARQVVATGNVWNGVSAGETSWSWDAEAAEVSDDASTFAQPSVTVHKAAGFIPISLEAAQDEANVAQEVSRLLADGKATLEAAAFATGTGSGQPFGIVTALNTIAGSIVTAATTAVFGAVDIYNVDGALPARYRARASWLANRSIYNEVRQLDTAGGSQLWETRLRVGGHGRGHLHH
jgi:HK97 family phage major capsid protein